LKNSFGAKELLQNESAETSTKTMKKYILLFLSFLSAAGCSFDTAQEPIRVGSKNFTEQFILAEILAQVIEHGTSLPVERTFNLGGTMICHNALVNGGIDLYPEYTGTALTAILQHDIVADPAQALREVSREYRRKFRLQWLEPFGFNNTYAITVRRKNALENDWAQISDLVGFSSELRAGFTSEFIERVDGYSGLKQKYDLAFKSVKDLDPGLMYKAIATGEVDVICGFSTDGRIKAYDLVPLKDDRDFFPPYFAAPVVRMDVLEKHPELQQALRKLGGIIDDKTMQQLNYSVDELKQSPQQAAAIFLSGKGLTTSPSDR
jgi:glycine betaine/choline ABC-type transport system substrate-binding protein